MKVHSTWVEKMKFTAQADQHQIEMDAKAPLGGDSALTPKQLLLAGVSGCTAMDVVALLRKFKQPLESFHIEADAPLTEGIQPAVFKEIKLTFKLTGEVMAEKVLEAVRLSQTKYCGVSAMVFKTVPISYTVELNGSLIGSGKADFA